jgi:ribosomal protein S27E
MEDHSHYVKRVQLPSGKTIEVVYFHDADTLPEQVSSFGPAVEPAQDLHVCTECASTLVYPTGWEEAGDDSWQVVLRCPECETVREGVFAQDTVDNFDERLDMGTDALTADLRRLTRANMAAEADAFVAALEAGAILPEDF